MTTEIFDPARGTSEPDRYWTNTNLGEATPDVLSPMCLTIWAEPAELSWLGAMRDLGVLARKAVVASPDVNDRGLSVFYGRQAFNVDALRATIAHLPGLSADDFERDLMGSVRENAPNFKGNPWRIPVIVVKAPWTLFRMKRRIRQRHDQLFAWWQDEVFASNHHGRDPIERLIDARERFVDVFTLHTGVRFMFQAVQSAVADASESAGDPTLATRLMSGIGDINETKMSDDLWRLAQGDLDLDSFLRSWGYHGPNEGNLYTTVWRENPAPINSLVQSMNRRGDTERPFDRSTRAQAAASEAEAQLLAAAPRWRRPGLRWLLNRLRGVVRSLHLGKSGYLMAIDGARSAVRDFGNEQTIVGNLSEPDDVFFLTLEECQALAAGELTDVAEIVSVRRSNRKYYKDLVLPVSFTGMPEPIVLDSTSTADGPQEISGNASGGGRVEGRARVVTDPNEDVELDDGDILVCRFTDPSWAPIMTLAEALVIDIGSSASHGAVVARELDIPYVIGTEIGTTVIKTGDRIVVDGEHNLVTITK